MSSKVFMVRTTLATLVLAALSLAAPLAASDLFLPEPVAVFEKSDAGCWERVELLRDPHPAFRQETFSPAGLQQDPWIIKWFGGKKDPHSGEFLLHCAPGFRSARRPVPVLLVHGAADNANRAWIHPLDHFLGPGQKPKDTGFALSLARDGFAVFAVTFAHSQGDDFMQAEHLANAIARIRRLLGRDADPGFSVDLVAHSKGGVAARLYLSDARTLFPKKTFLSDFRGDVRRWVAVGCPMLGVDTAFRYYGYNLWVDQQSTMNAPLAAEKMLLYGLWTDVGDRSIYTDRGNAFPGQCQVLYDLDGSGVEPLAPDSYTVDGNLTMQALYHGGTTLFLQSRGIKAAIAQGERLIYRLEERGIDPRVKLAVLAGKKPFDHLSSGGRLIPVWNNPLSPTSDGVVFLSSAQHVEGAMRRGAKLLGKEILDLNHLALAYDPAAFAQLERWLQDSERRPRE
ncbi:MAG: hypothetical protein HY303_09680 [Candidatus Wallbacteria bacterium]|nr:hypothetical protein [Candidatus Wallbacteria bacterium]